MRKISIIYLFASLLFVACSKDPILETRGFGNLTITLALTRSAANTVKSYAISTAKPTTVWAVNIKDMIMILSDANNVIQYVTSVPLSTATGNASETRTFTNIPAGTFTATIVANSGQSNIVTTGYSGGWNTGSLVGQNLNTLTLSAAPSATYIPAVGETGYTAYNSPAEIFVSSQSKITINTNATTTIATPFILTRIISLLRVRIDQSKYGNNIVDFTNPKADLRIENAPISYNLLTGVDTTPTSTDVIYDLGYNNTDPTTGYSSGVILDMANGITSWDDVAIFPGGSSSNYLTQFSLVIGAMAPTGYRPYNSKVLTSPTLVYWNGTVQGLVTSNNILQVNCVLVNRGSIYPLLFPFGLTSASNNSLMQVKTAFNR